MYKYRQSTGEVFNSLGVLVGTGWAGQGEGRNNPEMENVHGIGPLPKGIYAFTEPYHHPRLGRYVMNLVPDPTNNMFGRSVFRIHGSRAADDHPELSSEGCIVQDYDVRVSLWERPTPEEHLIEVVE